MTIMSAIYPVWFTKRIIIVTNNLNHSNKCVHCIWRGWQSKCNLRLTLHKSRSRVQECPYMFSVSLKIFKNKILRQRLYFRKPQNPLPRAKNMGWNGAWRPRGNSVEQLSSAVCPGVLEGCEVWACRDLNWSRIEPFILKVISYQGL